MNEKRTKLEICKAIFNRLFLSENPISPTELRRQTGLGGVSINEWIELIVFIQEQPKLEFSVRGRVKYLSLKKDVDEHGDLSKRFNDLITWIDLNFILSDYARKKLQKIRG